MYKFGSCTLRENVRVAGIGFDSILLLFCRSFALSGSWGNSVSFVLLHQVMKLMSQLNPCFLSLSTFLVKRIPVGQFKFVVSYSQINAEALLHPVFLKR